jgi:hypothetical protein
MKLKLKFVTINMDYSENNDETGSGDNSTIHKKLHLLTLILQYHYQRKRQEKWQLNNW